MKTLLIIFLLVPFYGIGQTQDSTSISDLKKKIFAMEEKYDANMIFMKQNFTRFHNQYSAGIVVQVIGWVGIGAAIATIKSKDNNGSFIGMGIGSAVAMTGVIIQMNSFRFIGRAGKSPASVNWKRSRE